MGTCKSKKAPQCGLFHQSHSVYWFNTQVHHDRLVLPEPGRWSWRMEREGGQIPIRSSTKQDNIPTGKSHTHAISVNMLKV